MTDGLPPIGHNGGPPLERENLLPGGATPVERAIADTDGRLDDIDVGLIRAVKDAYDAPAWALPYLAWERSVDVWDPAWPEAVKRAVIAAAPIVHRYKGTRLAVRTALAALGIDARIVEWWETLPRGVPYTFEVTAYARSKIYDGDFILDPRLIKVAFASVMRAKPLSRAFAFKVGAAFVGPQGLVGIGVATTQNRMAIHAPARIAGRGTLRLAGIGAARTIHRATIHLSAAA